MPDSIVNDKPGNDTPDIPNSPELKPGLKKHTPALTAIGQAVSLVDSLRDENRDRNIRNARIQDKYNAERPYDPNRLRSDGLSWKTNFSTKPLAALIDKVVPRFTTAVRNMRYITASKLPDNVANAAEKTEFFRREITNTCRQKEGWEELLSEIAQENALFGFAAVGWLDTTSWFPHFFRQDEFLAPQGTKHISSTAQVVCVRQSYLTHELFELISDPRIAKGAGWHVNNVIEAINKAVPESRRSSEADLSRVYSDLLRENSVITSFQGSKAVDVWHVLITEIDGFVTHVAFEAVSGKTLFWREDQFTSMPDCITFFSFQHGNGKLHGSKGIGRELYNMASVLDRSRNEVVDRLQLSGKLVISCDERDIKRFRMSVVGNAILIASGYQVQQGKIDGNVEPFFTLDRFLTDLLDQIAGSTSPKANEGERVTKAAVEIQAAREEERRDAIIERFLTQFARMVSTIQRRLCSRNTIDSTAKALQERLLTVLSREELDYLSEQPAVNTVPDFTEMERQRIVLIAKEARGNPLYNQHELERQSLTAQIGSEFADSVLLPVNDPTEQNENVRQQKIELGLLKNGEQVEVSPRDNHALHLAVLREGVQPLLEHAVEDTAVLPAIQNIGQHAADHIETAKAAGNGNSVAEFVSWLSTIGQAIQQLQQIDEQAVQQQQADAQRGQELAAQGLVPAPEADQVPVPA